MLFKLNVKVCIDLRTLSRSRARGEEREGLYCVWRRRRNVVLHCMRGGEVEMYVEKKEEDCGRGKKEREESREVEV